MKHTIDHEITLGFLLRFTLPSIIMMMVLSLYTFTKSAVKPLPLGMGI